jgi:hypothetical protein
MKKALFFTIIFLIGLSAFSQEECHDIIFTDDGNRMIFNCCIQEVVDGNTVVYTKDGKLGRIRAVAVTNDGQYYELEGPAEPAEKPAVVLEIDPDKYRGKDYKYYERLFYGARTRQRIGILFTFSGLGLEIAGIVMSNKDNLTTAEMNRAAGIYLAGAILENLGIPLWISGGIKKANNRKAMKKIKKQQDIYLGWNSYGVGVGFRF